MARFKCSHKVIAEVYRIKGWDVITKAESNRMGNAVKARRNTAKTGNSNLLRTRWV